MDVIRAPEALRAYTDARREDGASIGLVPTMGALHRGHAALIQRLHRERDVLVVSIFVNPLQFGAGEDFERYPRDEEADLAFCRAHAVDAVWAPSTEHVFPAGAHLTEPDPGPLGARLEGRARPSHFAGVLKVVHRLFDVTGPCAAAFGEKDAQQLFLIREMVKYLDLPVEVFACPTVREMDGLACSSRNALLLPAERAEAACLFLGLSEAAALARAGERDAGRLVAAVAREVGATASARLDYVEIVDEATFEPVGVLAGQAARALVAARFSSARLIDNLALPRGSS